MAPPLKKPEAHKILAEILKTLGQLDLASCDAHAQGSTQATALNDSSFTNPTTSALTRVQLSGRKVNVAKELTARQREIEVLGNEIDMLAVKISQGDPDYGVSDKSGPILSYTHAENFFRPPMMDAWDDVLKLQDCLKIHTNNAMEYHLFHAEVVHRTKSLENFRATADQRLKALRLTGKMEKDGDKLRDTVKDAMQALNIQTARIQYLSQKAPFILPINKRTEVKRSPQPAVAVANHRNRELQFVKQEDLILEDTSNELLWRIRTKEGNPSLVPALLVLIPGPDHDAINAARTLMSTLLDLWTWCMKYMGCLLLEALRRLLAGWNQQDLNYETMDKSQAELLAKILKHSKDVIKLWKGTQLYTDVTNLIDQTIKKTNDYQRRSQDGKPLSLTKQDVTMFGDEIVYYAHLTGYYHDLEEAWKRFRLLMGLDGDDFNMNSDEIQEFLRRNFESEVRIEETTETAETEDITRSEQQQQQRLVISAVVDPRDGGELGLKDAIAAGILNMDAGLYINPITKATKAIPEAMTEGLIQVEKATVTASEWYEDSDSDTNA